MEEEACYWLLCFVPPEAADSPRIFGFSEFITALALLVLLYTIADIRYKFRLTVTPGALYLVTFGLIVFIGVGTLATEVWLAEGWWVPRSTGLSRTIWQAMFGMLFLGAFLTWMYYAFLRPPIFSRRNWYKYGQTLFRVVLKGDDSELPVIADELGRSAFALVKLAKRVQLEGPRKGRYKPGVEGYAHDMLLLIANRKLCRHIIRSAPNTALRFFDAMTLEKKYNIPIGQFAKAISAEAIAYKESALYQEDDGFESGLIGYLKPWTRGIYGNIELVERLGDGFGSPLDIGYQDVWSWDADQWEAYCRAILMTFESYLIAGWGGRHSYALWRAVGELETALMGLHKIDGIAGAAYETDEYKRLDVVVKFVRHMVLLMDKQERPVPGVLRQRKQHVHGDLYGLIANLIFEILVAASHVKGPPDFAWSVHHNSTWGEIFSFASDSKTWKIIHHRVRRLLYDEVAEVADMPNYKNAALLGLLLNVIGFGITRGKQSMDRDYWPLARAVQSVAKRNYMTIRDRLPDVADAVLIGGVTFDEGTRRLVKTYSKGLEREPVRRYLELDPPREAAAIAER
jgi:hypothetical protein